MKRSLLLDTLSLLFSVLFLYTAISKVLEHDSFVFDLSRDPMIGKTTAVILSVALPLVELAVATLLFIPKTQKYALWMTVALMSAFTIYVRWMLHNPTRHCTCGGVLRQMSWRQHLCFNIVFTILSMTALLIHASLHHRPRTEVLRTQNP